MNFVTEGLPVWTDTLPSSRTEVWLVRRRYEATENNGRNSTTAAVPQTLQRALSFRVNPRPDTQLALQPQHRADLSVVDDLTYITDMRRLVTILQGVWTFGLLLAGVVIGSSLGYAIAGVIGGICLAVGGILLAAFLAAPSGLRMLLQVLRLLEIA
jgi:hypothetical protein